MLALSGAEEGRDAYRAGPTSGSSSARARFNAKDHAHKVVRLRTRVSNNIVNRTPQRRTQRTKVLRYGDSSLCKHKDGEDGSRENLVEHSGVNLNMD